MNDRAQWQQTASSISPLAFCKRALENFKVAKSPDSRCLRLKWWKIQIGGKNWSDLINLINLGLLKFGCDRINCWFFGNFLWKFDNFQEFSGQSFRPTRPQNGWPLFRHFHWKFTKFQEFLCQFFYLPQIDQAACLLEILRLCPKDFKQTISTKLSVIGSRLTALKLPYSKFGGCTNF